MRVEFMDSLLNSLRKNFTAEFIVSPSDPKPPKTWGRFYRFTAEFIAKNCTAEFIEKNLKKIFRKKKCFKKLS
jgi:hypothetical protein